VGGVACSATVDSRRGAWAALERDTERKNGVMAATASFRRLYERLSKRNKANALTQYRRELDRSVSARLSANQTQLVTNQRS
jgi:hypothetical protein